MNNSKQRRRGKWAKTLRDKGLLLRGANYSIRFRDQFGKLQTESIGPSKEFARKVLEKRRTEVREGQYFPAIARARISFEEIIDDALESTRAAHTRKYEGSRRFRDYRYGIIRRWFPGRAAASIPAAELQTRLTDHAKTPATFNQYRVALSKAYKLAIANKKATENPAVSTELQKLNNGRERYLNQFTPAKTEDPELKSLKDEESRLRAVIRRRSPAKEAEFDLALFTGLRWGEQYGLRWRNVDLEHKLITIELGKSGKREHLPLNRTALRALVELRRHASTDGAEAANELVCPEQTEWAHRQWWSGIKQEAGVRDFRWHDLRHTFASRLVMADVNILKVQKLMRHKTIEMTLRYAHLAPEDLQEAIEKLTPAKCTKSVQLPSAAAPN